MVILDVKIAICWECSQKINGSAKMRYECFKEFCKFYRNFRGNISKHLRREFYKILIKEDDLYLGNKKLIIKPNNVIEFIFQRLQRSLMEMDCAFSCSCFFDKLALMGSKKKKIKLEYIVKRLRRTKKYLRFSMNSM